MNSRERMLSAIRGETPDHVPLSFMIFEALRTRESDWFKRIDAQLELGIDPMADMTHLTPEAPTIHPDTPGLPVNLPPDVTMRQWKEKQLGERYPVLHKEYATPDGVLHVAVNQTEDWEHGEDVPLFSDFLVPRCTRYMVESEEDLPALRHLLGPPRPEDAAQCADLWAGARQFARDRGLLLAAGWGVGADALGWLCGLENAVWMAIDRPDLLDAVLDVVSDWNRPRMTLMLEAGPDLFLRRAWYEGTACWSPALFRRFLLPRIKAEVKLAHEAGASFGYILTVGGMQFADLLAEAGIDVLIGIDPVQDHGMAMAKMKAAAAGKFALWGGVNGFVTVERGSREDVRAAVRQAMDEMGPDGFILSPVDNVVDPGDQVWHNVLELIEAWQDAR